MARKKDGVTTNIKTGDIDNVSGQLNIAGGDIIQTITQNITTIQKRALTVAEEATKARNLEKKLLAQGIGVVIRSLSDQVSQGTENDSPYKGLLSYSLSEAGIFFGRNDAKKGLLHCIKQSSLTVLHAESGAGKSSLMQAGIAAQLIANGHLALYLRPHNADPEDFIKRMFLPELTQAPGLKSASLREFLRQVSAVLGTKVSLYLLLDQFEEFFRFLTKDERQPFLESLADCLNDPSLKVRWVLALRAEGLSDLAEFESFGITPFKNTYRLNRLNRDEAKEAIVEPAKRHGIKFEPDLIDHILESLTKNGEVIPTQLQLVCSALTDDLKDNKTLTLSYYIEHEGDTEGILRDYLKRRLDDLPTDERVLAWKVLRALITSDLHRTQKTFTEIIEEIKSSAEEKEQINKILERLIERRLLFTQSTTTETYELAHDSLVKEIQLDPNEQALKAAQELLDQDTRSYQRHKTLISAGHLAVIQPHEKDLHFSTDARELFDKSKRTVGRRRITTLGIAAAVAIALAVLGLWGLGKAGLADINAANANAESTRAFDNASTAEANLVVANTAQADAIKKQATAESAQATAVANEQIALARQWAAEANVIVSNPNGNAEIAALLSLRALKQQEIYDSSTDTALVESLNHLYTEKIFSQHNQIVRQVAYSPKGDRVLIGYVDGTADLYDLETYKVLKSFDGFDAIPVDYTPEYSGVIAADFSQTGDYLLVAGSGGRIHIWNQSTNSGSDIYLEETPDISFDGMLWSAKFSPNENYILVSTGFPHYNPGHIFLLDRETGELKYTFDTPNDRFINDVEFSTDGKLALSTSYDGKAILWDMLWNEDGSITSATPREPIQLPTPIRDGAISSDGKFILLSSDNVAYLYDTNGILLKQFIGHTNTIFSVVFESQGNYILTTSWDKTSRLWSIETGKTVRTFIGHTGEIWSSAFSPDGKYILTGSADGTARLWIANPTHNRRATFGDTGQINSVSFSPSGDTILSASRDNSVRLWNSETLETEQILSESLALHNPKAVFSAQGQWVAASSEGKIILWEKTDNGYQQKKILEPGGNGSSVFFSPKMNGTDSNYLFFHVPTYSIFEIFEASGKWNYVGEVSADRYDGYISIPQDSKYLAIANNFDSTIYQVDGNAQLKDLAYCFGVISPGKPHGTGSIALSHDGKYLASQVVNNILISEWQSPGCPEKITLTGHSGNISDLAFSPDDNYLLSASADGTTILWDTTTWRIKRILTGHEGEITSLAFSPNGKFIVTGGIDNTIRLWDTELEDTVNQVCAFLQRDFTDEEREEYGVPDHEPTCGQ